MDPDGIRPCRWSEADIAAFLGLVRRETPWQWMIAPTEPKHAAHKHDNLLRLAGKPIKDYGCYSSKCLSVPAKDRHTLYPVRRKQPETRAIADAVIRPVMSPHGCSVNIELRRFHSSSVARALPARCQGS